MTNLELSTEAWLDKKSLKRFLNGTAQVGFHVLLVALSAGIALSLRDASGKEISREKTDTLYQPSNGRQTPRQELYPLSSTAPS